MQVHLSSHPMYAHLQLTALEPKKQQLLLLLLLMHLKIPLLLLIATLALREMLDESQVLCCSLQSYFEHLKVC